MIVLPSAIAAIIAKRWLMDLSPGTDMTPLSLNAGVISTELESIIYWRQVSMVIDFEKPLVLPRVNDF